MDKDEKSESVNAKPASEKGQEKVLILTSTPAEEQQLDEQQTLHEVKKTEIIELKQQDNEETDVYSEEAPLIEAQSEQQDVKDSGEMITKFSIRSSPEKKVRTNDGDDIRKSEQSKQKTNNSDALNSHKGSLLYPDLQQYNDVKESTQHQLVRRNTVVEEAEESLLQARKSISSTKQRKNSVKESWVEMKKDLINSEYREFMGRDSVAWFKLSIFYCIFYAVLAGFFILLLYLFYHFKIDMKKPNYFYKDSVMNYKGVNPGLGFRPQLDLESELIQISSKEYKNNIYSIELFLDKYEKGQKTKFTGAHGRKQIYDYEEAIKDTPCSRENHFGLNTESPCIIVKLNRIYGWLPKALSKPPGNLTKVFFY